MPSLPSFVELMASLGLEEEASFSQRSSAFSRPRSSSNATSCSSTHDDESGSPWPQHTQTGNYLLVPSRHGRHSSVDVDAFNVPRRGQGRYTPYLAVHVPRKMSMPSIYSDADADMPKRAFSTSPLRSSAGSPRSIRGSRSGSASRSGHRSQKSWATESDLPAITPISTFVRRKSPHSPSVSPTVPTFPPSVHDVLEPLSPVAIPALPSLLPSFLLPSPSAETVIQPSGQSMEVEGSNDSRRHHGIRISTSPHEIRKCL